MIAQELPEQNEWIDFIQDCHEDGATDEDSFSDMMSVVDMAHPGYGYSFQRGDV